MKKQDAPIWNEEQIKKVQDYLQSEEGRKKTAEILKPESEMEKWARQHKEEMWWHSIKDKPFTI